MLTIEELMLPRYKVIIRYPHYPFDGDVLIVNEQGELIHETEGYPQSIYKILEKDIKDNPCFRLMAWHEDRKISDMPIYVKIKPTDRSKERVVKAEWKDDGDGEIYFTYKGDPKSDIGYDPRSAEAMPATEAEYLAYTNSTTKQD